MRRLHLRSPPRVRGKVIVRSRNAVQIGITPAYAGKRMLYARAVRRDRDHPRVCGEKRLVKRRARCLGGSPPRMRGKDLCDVICGQQSGITPAYAGKRYPYQYAEYCIGDHPRVCGEKVGPVGCVSGWLGSPPRMRGKVWHGVALADGHRITPAYAGKSCIYRSTTSISWDHPRVCGEKSFKTSTSCWSKGSPPRMRGKGIQPCNQWVRVGITPAYAGKSIQRGRPDHASRDHPRVCGEKKCRGRARHSESGSPPRMRGKAPERPV